MESHVDVIVWIFLGFAGALALFELARRFLFHDRTLSKNRSTTSDSSSADRRDTF